MSGGWKETTSVSEGTSAKYGGKNTKEVMQILNGLTVPGKSAPIGKQIIPLSTDIADYSTPATAESVDTTLTPQTHNNTGTDYSLGAAVTAIQFTGLALQEFSQVEFDFIVGFATGNVRIKVYSDNADAPDVLQVETASLPIPGSGKQSFALPSSVIIPASGKIWIGIEGDLSGDKIESSNAGTGIAKIINHTYGTGPDPYGTGSPQSFVPYISILTGTNGPGSSIDGDTATRFETNSVVTPELIIDHGSLSELVSVSVNKHANDTVSLAKLQMSPDKIAWTDFRRLDWANDFTTGVNEFILNNRPLEQMRYVRIIGDDGGTPKVLAIAEIEIRALTESIANRTHEHKTISPTDIILKPNGDP